MLPCQGLDLLVAEVTLTGVTVSTDPAVSWNLEQTDRGTTSTNTYEHSSHQGKMGRLLCFPLCWLHTHSWKGHDYDQVCRLIKMIWNLLLFRFKIMILEWYVIQNSIKAHPNLFFGFNKGAGTWTWVLVGTVTMDSVLAHWGGEKNKATVKHLSLKMLLCCCMLLALGKIMD
jgi:hypothetical protein